MKSSFVPLMWTVLAVVFINSTPGLAGSAYAAHSDWAVNEGGRMRLILMDGDETGHYDAALQIEPNPGWITYWREPGDSGIPPQIDVAADSPYELRQMRFPVPVRIDNGPVRDVGYDGPVTVPLTFSGPPADAGKTLDATVFIGICKNICIPFQAAFSVDPPMQTDVEDALVIAEALRRLPETPSDGFAVTDVSLSLEPAELSLDLSLPQTTAEPEIFVTGPPGTLLLDYKVTKKAPGQMSVTMPIDRLPSGDDPSGQVWTILVKAEDRAMEAPLAFN